jgi:Prephenate dehydrogenase
VLADICGVKSRLYPALEEMLPPTVEYIGLHPMAGKERDGFENADPAIYRNCGFIICPVEGTADSTVRLMRELAQHIGAARIAVTSPDRQDEIIAYTSGLMHIAAAGLCLDFHPQMSSAFAAGAFRDCTRVADINAGAWTELLMDNRPAILDQLGKYMASLECFRRALADSDEASLHSLLETAGNNKRKMLQL